MELGETPYALVTVLLILVLVTIYLRSQRGALQTAVMTYKLKPWESADLVQTSAPRIDRLRIMTYNSWGLPPHINPSAPRKRSLEAAARIATEAKFSDVDIVCLQEIFDHKVADNFANALGDSFPYRVSTTPPSGLAFMNPGLTVYSKFPVATARFHPFKQLCGADNMSNKGILECLFHVGGGETMRILNTHVQADPGNDPLWFFTRNPAYRARTCKQSNFEQIAGVVSDGVCDRKICASFVIGDLNVDAEVDPEGHQGLIKALNNPMDCWNAWSTTLPSSAHSSRRFKGLTHDGRFNVVGDNPGVRLDYVFALPGSRVQVTASSMVVEPMFKDGDTSDKSYEWENIEANIKPRKCLSDHFAVVATLDLSS
jgi:endonuclease/exonuclease/phosphatase family metal-dependent hydrolase